MTIDPIAIYGAIVATGVLLWSILKDRPRVKIKLMFQIGGEPDNSGVVPVGIMDVTIINKGRDTIYIEDVGFTYLNGDTCEIPIYLFPKLEKGRSVLPKSNVFFQIDGDAAHALTNGKRVKYFWVRDKTLNIHRAKIPSDIVF